MRQIRASSGTGPKTRTRFGFGVAQQVGQRRDADARFHRVHQAQHAVVARGVAGVGHHLAQPLRRAVVRHRVVEADQVVLREFGHAGGLAVARDVFAAGVHRPGRIADLAAHQRFVVGVARAQRDVGFAAREVQVLVAHHEFDLQARVELGEAAHQLRMGQARHQRFGTGHAHDAGDVAPRAVHLLLQGMHRLLPPAARAAAACWPNSVRLQPVVWRLTSGWPRQRSSSPRRLCTVDWFTPSARLAPSVLPCRATASRYCRSLQSRRAGGYAFLRPHYADAGLHTNSERTLHCATPEPKETAP